MRILFDRWGYRSSIYHVPSRLWLWFKSPEVDVEAAVQQLGSPGDVIAECGFAAYWTKERLESQAK